jgi:hypothetical protein
MDNQMKNKQISQKYEKKARQQIRKLEILFADTNKEMWSQHEKYEIEGQIEKEKQNENVISI